MTTAVSMSPVALPELPAPARAEQGVSKAEPKIGRSPKATENTQISSPRSSTKDKTLKLARDNAVTIQLTKTKMCAFFERGKCASANCRYAHSAAELRSAPDLHKTKLCRAFLSGGCNDENCFYAHGEGDLRVTDGIYKTQICNFFERGYCKKGDRCNHAHGTNDLRPPTPSTVASTPLGKTSPSSQGDSTRQRRSPLPLSELLVIDSEANMGMSPHYNTIPPTPTKSVTELAQLAFSPAAQSPMWGQYPPVMHPLSPMSALGPMGDVTSMWPPRDAVDMLVQDQRMVSPAANLMYTMETMDPHMEMLEQQFPDHTPEKTLQLLSLASPAHRPAPGLCEPPRSTPPHSFGSTEAARMSPPGLEEPTPPPKEDVRDPLMVNLSERLASLDRVVLSLGNDIAAIKSDPQKQLHRI